MSIEVHVDVTTPIATVRVDPSEKHSFLTIRGWQALAEALDVLAARDDLGCVVVCGTGARTLSAGSDLASLTTAGETPEDVWAYSVAIDAALLAVRCCRHPTVAVIEGLCAGGGLEIAACCDLRVCGESSRFGRPIDRRGLMMSSDGPEPLVQLLGASPLLDILLGGDLIGAERALTYGIVNRVHADAAVVEQGYGLAARIAAGAPLVNRWHKKLVQRLRGRRSLSTTPYEPRGRAD